jgi:hypothetical protein
MLFQVDAIDMRGVMSMALYLEQSRRRRRVQRVGESSFQRLLREFPRVGIVAFDEDLLDLRRLLAPCAHRRPPWRRKARCAPRAPVGSASFPPESNY